MAKNITSKNTRRNDRNNPYLFDGWAVDFHRSVAGVAWRWRTELFLFAAALAAFIRLALVITALGALIVFAATLSAALAVPPSRHFLRRWAWCVISRHRLQRVFYETRMHTRSGRLPLIMWITPTRVGERAWILCRAGVCFEDFEAYRAEIGAACYAREARVTRDKKWSNFITLDIVRHDPLHAKAVIPSQVITGTAQPGHAIPPRKETVA